jgi:hypothetical protein
MASQSRLNGPAQSRTKKPAHGLKGRKKPVAESLECRKAFEALLPPMLRQLSPKAGSRDIPKAERHLRDIYSSLEFLHDENMRKLLLCTAFRISMCFSSPIDILRSFRESYSQLCRSNSEGLLGKNIKIYTPRLKQMLASLQKNARSLMSARRMAEIRNSAARAGPPGQSTYENLPCIHRSDVDSLLCAKASEELSPEEKAIIAGFLDSIDLHSERNFASAIIAKMLGSIISIGLEERDIALSAIFQTCRLYPNPISVLQGFEQAYQAAEEIAETRKRGLKFPVQPGFEQAADSFEERLQHFISCEGLSGLLHSARESGNGKGSTYEIPFVSVGQLKEITSSKPTHGNWEDFILL